MNAILASLLLACPRVVSAIPKPGFGTGSTYNSTNATRPKVILDNDWSTAGFIPYLMALSAGWDVLGLTSGTSNSWARQCGLHALATLERGSLGCIPVFIGSDYPLLNTPKLFQAWEDIHGVLPWEGAFAKENETYEALGNDPTSGSPDRIVRAAFVEGYPNITVQAERAAEFLVQQVRKYPGEVSLYAAGAMTNIALAVRMDPDFAKNAKSLTIMGGYIDVNLLQTTGSTLQADLNSDINLMIDPEASKIALTAAFPTINIAGNVANQVMSTQSFLDEIYEVKNPYTELMYNHYGTEFPFWDETAAAIMIGGDELVKNSTSFYIDVDTSYSSPNYGNIHAYQQALMPAAQTLRTVNYVLEVDGDRLKQMIKMAVQAPPTCAQLGR